MIQYKTSIPEGFEPALHMKWIADWRFGGEKVLCQKFVETDGGLMYDGDDVLRVKREIWVAVDCLNGTLEEQEKGPITFDLEEGE